MRRKSLKSFGVATISAFVLLLVAAFPLFGNEAEEALNQVVEDLESDLQSISSAVMLKDFIESNVSDGVRAPLPTDGVDKIISAFSVRSKEGKQVKKLIHEGGIENTGLHASLRDYFIVALSLQYLLSKDGDAVVEYLKSRTESDIQYLDLLIYVCVSAFLPDSGQDYKKVAQGKWLELGETENDAMLLLFYENAHCFITDRGILEGVYTGGLESTVSAIKAVCTYELNDLNE